jgi:hypothetical protein
MIKLYGYYSFIASEAERKVVYQGKFEGGEVYIKYKMFIVEQSGKLV